MVIFNKIWKKYNEIQLTKSKMDLNNRKWKTNLLFPVLARWRKNVLARWRKNIFVYVGVGSKFSFKHISLNFWCNFSAVNFLVSVSNFLKISFVELLRVLKTIFEYQYITNLSFFYLVIKSQFFQWIKFAYYSATKILIIFRLELSAIFR